MKKVILRVVYLGVILSVIGIGLTSAEFRKEVPVGNNNFSTSIWNPGRATISEVLYNPAGTDGGKEWIEIANTGGYELNLTGYLLHFDAATVDYVFPEYSLPAGGVVVVHVKTSGEDSQSDLYWENTGDKNMNNSGSVSLFKRSTKNAANIVDFVEFGGKNQDSETTAVNAGIWSDDQFVAQVAEGSSIELINKQDNNLPSDWQEQSSPNPGV